MSVRNVIIIGFISIVTLVSPILFLLRLISANVAFPFMFTMLGVQQLSLGLLVAKKGMKKTRFFTIVFGTLFILFGLGIVLPYYYFNN